MLACKSVELSSLWYSSLSCVLVCLLICSGLPICTQFVCKQGTAATGFCGCCNAAMSWLPDFYRKNVLRPFCEMLSHVLRALHALQHRLAQ